MTGADLTYSDGSTIPESASDVDLKQIDLKSALKVLDDKDSKTLFLHGFYSVMCGKYTNENYYNYNSFSDLQSMVSGLRQK